MKHTNEGVGQETGYDTHCTLFHVACLPTRSFAVQSHAHPSPFIADVLVRSQEGENTPARVVSPGQTADGDEVVVFDPRAILPQFVVEVTLKAGRS